MRRKYQLFWFKSMSAGWGWTALLQLSGLFNTLMAHSAAKTFSLMDSEHRELSREDDSLRWLGMTIETQT